MNTFSNHENPVLKTIEISVGVNTRVNSEEDENKS